MSVVILFRSILGIFYIIVISKPDALLCYIFGVEGMEELAEPRRLGVMFAVLFARIIMLYFLLVPIGGDITTTDGD